MIRYQAPFWPMHYSRNDALYEAYMNIEQIMQKNCPHITLEGTFHIPCPIPDAADAPTFHDPDSPVQPTVEELSGQAETMSRQKPIMQ
jgi:hypothetical protein